jgi:hypothetical protein
LETDMSTRHLTLAAVLATSVFAIGTATASAQTCWDFATLDQSNLYRLGDVFRAPTATIEMKHYLLNGNKNSNPAGVAHAQPTQIAGGPSPEFRLYLLNAHITPDTPVNTFSYQFGLMLNGVSGLGHANLGVNGELVEVTTSMASLNNQVLGDPALGTVLVTVNMTTPPGASPERGTVQLQALTGSIQKVTIGGIQMFIDRVCFP